MRKPERRAFDDVVEGIVDAREARIERLVKLTKRARRDLTRFIRF